MNYKKKENFEMENVTMLEQILSQVRLLNDSTLEVTVEYRYKLVPTYKNTITCEWKNHLKLF